LLLILPSIGRGGAEEYALTIAAEAVRRGWTVSVAHPFEQHGHSLREDFMAIGAHCIDADLSEIPAGERRHRAAQALINLARALRVLRAAAPDVAYIGLPWYDMGFGSVIGCALRGVPTAVVFHLMPYAAPLSTVKRAAYALARRRRQRWIAVSEHNRECIAQTFAMPSSGISVIHNGIDRAAHAPRDVEQARRSIRHELGLSDGAPLALAVGRLDEQKGYKDAIMALAEVRPTYPLSLAIVGTGPQQSELEELAERRGVADAVFFLGYRRDVARLLDAADMFVFPSLWEGLPLALLEAMSHGVPLVVSDIGPVLEVVRDRIHARVHKADDWRSLLSAMQSALEDPDEMKRMAARASERVRYFSDERMLEQTLAVLVALKR
jgi:glycosyltransferase involved in cell wall biosynthesis